jgi:two-component system OmpR family sensor kinase
VTSPVRPASIRWWSSARLRITAGITLTAAVVLAAVVLIALQLLAIASDSAVQKRLDREAGDFTTFYTAGVIPSNGDVTPTPEHLVRAYLAQQYPEASVLLVGTATGSGTQFTLSRYDVDDDPLFPAETRSRLQEIGLTGAAEAGRLEGTTVDWRRVVSDSPVGRANLVAAINHADDRADSARVAELLMITSAGGLLLTALMAWLLAGRMLVPVRRIREAADTISADDLSRRVPVDGPDEVVALADTVNAMLERVEDSYRTQREFLDDAGHELRTPLTVVQGNLDLLPDDPADRAETTRIMQDELSRMSRIVEDLLTLARADRPDFLQLAPADVSDLVIDVEAKVEVVADRAWTVLPFAEGEAMLDKHRITQALLQFCSNAVRFTRPGDRIEISCRVVPPGTPTVPGDDVAGTLATPPPGEIHQRRLLWCVRDQGAGIPEGEEESIFERFHTARGQLRDGRGGTGLGLAIVSTIARGHEGRAFAYNRVGGGAAFCIVVPFIRPPSRASSGTAGAATPATPAADDPAGTSRTTVDSPTDPVGQARSGRSTDTT